jgi:hypothetical protein
MMSGKDWTNYQFEVIPANSSYVAANRNSIGVKFLETDMDYLFYWDYDNGLFPEAFDMFMDVMENNKDVNILSGMYFRKDPSYQLVCGIMDDQCMGSYRIDPMMFIGGGLTNLTTVAGSVKGMLGAGCLMLRREVIEKLPFPWFESGMVISELKGRWVHTTEDTFFCELAQEHGYDVYMDTRIRSPHYAGGNCFPGEWRQFGDGVGDPVIKEFERKP